MYSIGPETTLGTPNIMFKLKHTPEYCKCKYGDHPRLPPQKDQARESKNGEANTLSDRGKGAHAHHHHGPRLEPKPHEH